MNCNCSKKVKGFFLIGNYDHIMIERIRIHLYKKEFERIGVKDPEKAAKDFSKR